MEDFHFRKTCHHIPRVFEAVDRRRWGIGLGSVLLSLSINKEMNKERLCVSKDVLVQSIEAPQGPYASMTSDKFSCDWPVSEPWRS